MQDCLVDYIGIMGCGTQNPGSGLFINSLPGITLKSIQQIANSEQRTYQGVWKDVQLRALRKFYTGALSKMNECYKISDSAVMNCLICEKVELFATAIWYLLGAELMVETKYSERFNWYTTMNAEQADELKDYYQVEYEKEFLSAIKGLNPENSDCVTGCLEENSSVKWVESVNGI